DLICSAISPIKNESEYYKSIKLLIDASLLPLINRVNVLANEAEQVTEIRAVDDELRLVDSLSTFAERTIIAVAGGFSSGKSSLISSFFADEAVKLPIGIEPVTAIPTYVGHADNIAIRGYSHEGGYFDVSKHIYACLLHQFVEEFGFNFRDLVPFMSLEVPFKLLRHIAFIDLPGYNPGQRGGTTMGDQAVSDEFITQGQALIWVIGLDSNGTIPRDDLDKLSSLNELDMPLYVILNKADLRPQGSLDEILDQVTEELMMSGIPYEGVSAYSSATGIELAFRERSLLEVLAEWDQPRDAIQIVAQKLEHVIAVYEHAIKADIESRKKKVSLIKALELNLLEIGVFDTELFSSEFDVEAYMGEEPQENIPTSGSFSWLARSLWGGGYVTNTTKEKSAKAATAEKKQAPLQASQLDSIRDQLETLRDDYSTKKSEEDLKELQRIRCELQSLLQKKSKRVINPAF
ncbi:GTPase domain-containing protein, partial [Vibrio sp. V06_P1A73T115]